VPAKCYGEGVCACSGRWGQAGGAVVARKVSADLLARAVRRRHRVELAGAMPDLVHWPSLY